MIGEEFGPTGLEVLTCVNIPKPPTRLCLRLVPVYLLAFINHCGQQVLTELGVLFLELGFGGSQRASDVWNKVKNDRV